MKLSHAAPAAARLSVISEKSQTALTKALSGWFKAQFVAGIKLGTLRAIHQTGAYAAFAELLADAPDAERIAILKKVDPLRKDMLSAKTVEQLGHIEALATGKLEPEGPPSSAKTPGVKGGSPKKALRPRTPKGIISESKY
jgi:hypothetical protein